MKWLLIIMMFTVDADGNPATTAHRYAIYDSKEACEATGRTAREAVLMPEGTKWLTLCIPESIFTEDIF